MLLFAQSLFAALPCQMSGQGPAMAFTDMAGMECAQKGNPNACLQQCTIADQSTTHFQVAIAVTPLVAALIVPLADRQVILHGVAAARPIHFPDPPPSIRFCSFQL